MIGSNRDGKLVAYFCTVEFLRMRTRTRTWKIKSVVGDRYSASNKKMEGGMLIFCWPWQQLRVDGRRVWMKRCIQDCSHNGSECTSNVLMRLYQRSVGCKIRLRESCCTRQALGPNLLQSSKTRFGCTKRSTQALQEVRKNSSVQSCTSAILVQSINQSRRSLSYRVPCFPAFTYR